MTLIERSNGERYEFMDTAEGVTLVLDTNAEGTITRGASGLEIELRDRLRGAVERAEKAEAEVGRLKAEVEGWKREVAYLAGHDDDPLTGT